MEEENDKEGKNWAEDEEIELWVVGYRIWAVK